MDIQPTALPTQSGDDGLLVLTRALLLVQVGVIVTATIESLVVGAASANLVALPALNGGFAVWTMFLMRGLGRESARARRWVMRLQVGWLGLAAIDLALAGMLADRGLEPVPVVTRMLIPLLIIRLLRAPDPRQRFEEAA